MQKEESSERGERDARQSRKGSGSDLGRVANEKDLRNRTKTFALRVSAHVLGASENNGSTGAWKELLRSGTSIGANYREAFRARSKAEFIAKCGDSLREIEESAYWLELLVESGVLSTEKLAPLRQEWSQREAVRHRRSKAEVADRELGSSSQSIEAQARACNRVS